MVFNGLYIHLYMYIYICVLRIDIYVYILALNQPWGLVMPSLLLNYAIWKNTLTSYWMSFVAVVCIFSFTVHQW